MSLAARLAKLEEITAARQAAEHAAALAEFNVWAKANWTEGEHDLWTRHLLNYPTPADFLDRLSMSRAEAEKIIAEYPPLAPDEISALELAWEKVPLELRDRLHAP